MSRVITFSRVFPKGHPKEGQPTYFIEKIQRSLDINKSKTLLVLIPQEVIPIFDFIEYSECLPKHHTIRSGHRFKVGDKFSPRVWSGKPYQSKQIIIAPDIEVKKTWDFELKNSHFKINGRVFNGETEGDHELLEKISLNDGLSISDFKSWFQVHPKTIAFNFEGQIICWNEQINY